MRKHFADSVVVHYILPRQVVKPLLELKKFVDHAAAGNFEVQLDVQGKGEVAEQAVSLRNIFAAVQASLKEKRES
jgi:methyl-accepting chemotaxis protein